MKVIFSPHIDDAFLSLGGSILNWIDNNEEVRVVNIFSISNYTKDGVGDSREITEKRKNEELNVSKITDVKVSFLDFPECLLRGYKMKEETPFYPDMINEEIDKALLEKVEKAALKEIDRAAYCFFPLGAGSHVDHLLVRDLGETLISKKIIKRIAFYEDIPYIGWYALPEQFIKKMNLNPHIETIEMQRKIKVVENYHSQIEEEWVKAMKNYASKLLKNKKAERVWFFK